MDMRDFKNFITKRSTIWTLSLCMTGIVVLGSIAAVENTRRTKEKEKLQAGTEISQEALLDESAADPDRDIEDELFPTLDGGDQDNMAQASGNVVAEDTAPDDAAELPGDGVPEDIAEAEDEAAAAAEADEVQQETPADGEAAEDAVSDEVISEQALLDAGIDFSDEESLLWPSAGTILIDYSMDGSVYFPTLDQYRYNPALIIGSEAGNQVLASAKGIVESVSVRDETGITLVLNIGSGYKLTYGQLKELAVAEGDVVEAGELLGYVSEPTKYYSLEGSNLYFGMTQDDAAVDPVLYLE